VRAGPRRAPRPPAAACLPARPPAGQSGKPAPEPCPRLPAAATSPARAAPSPPAPWPSATPRSYLMTIAPRPGGRCSPPRREVSAGPRRVPGSRRASRTPHPPAPPGPRDAACASGAPHSAFSRVRAPARPPTRERGPPVARRKPLFTLRGSSAHLTQPSLLSARCRADRCSWPCVALGLAAPSGRLCICAPPVLAFRAVPRAFLERSSVWDPAMTGLAACRTPVGG
jgi:hypothetical protein